MWGWRTANRSTPTTVTFSSSPVDAGERRIRRFPTPSGPSWSPNWQRLGGRCAANAPHARQRVNDAKVALGERGDPWWDPTPSGQRTRLAATMQSLLRHREPGGDHLPERRSPGRRGTLVAKPHEGVTIGRCRVGVGRGHRRPPAWRADRPRRRRWPRPPRAWTEVHRLDADVGQPPTLSTPFRASRRVHLAAGRCRSRDRQSTVVILGVCSPRPLGEARLLLIVASTFPSR